MKIKGIIGKVREHGVASKAIGKALSISVLNQVISSGTSFFLGIYLVLNLTPEEFGLYGIGFAISLFYAGIGNALFLTQMVIHMPDKVPEDRLPYAARICVAVVLFCLVTIILVGFIILIGRLFCSLFLEYSSFIFVVTMSSISCMIRDYVVRHAYNMQKECWVFEINLLIMVMLICFLTATHYSGVFFSAVVALFCNIIPNIVGIVYGLFRAHLNFSLININKIINDAKEIIVHGLWATTMVIAASLRGYTLTFIVAAILGPIGVAQINASRLFISPVYLIYPIVSQVMLPRMAQQISINPQFVIRLATISLMAFLSVTIAYSVIVILMFNSLSLLILKTKFDTILIFNLVTILLIHAFVLSIKNAQELVLQVAKKFKQLAIMHIFVTIFTYIFMFFLINEYGLIYGIIGFLISEVVLVFIVSIPVFSVLKRL